MTSHEIIDLCFSSEDEHSLPVAATAGPSETTTVSLPRWTSKFGLGDEDLSDLRTDPLDSEQPLKKRKLSSPVLPTATEDEIFGPRVGASLKITTSHSNSRLVNRGGDFDEILFTSSSQPQARSREPIPKTISSSSDDSEIDSSSPRLRRTTTLSTRTAALLAEISRNSRRPLEKKGTGIKKVKKVLPDHTNDPLDSRTSQPTRTRLTSVEQEAKNLEKQSEKLRKAKAKEDAKEIKRLETEAGKERRKLEKEQKAREKQAAADLTEVNKARWDKKISAPEMIVDLPASIDGKSVDTQVRYILKQLRVETSSYSSLLPDIIKWRRKVSAVFNEEMGHWERAPRTVQDEKHALCLIPGKSFAAMASSHEKDESVDTHIAKVKSKFPDSNIIYLIEGLETLVKKGKNAKNRSYQAAVRHQGADQQAGAEESRDLGGRSNAQSDVHVNEDAVEDALLRLQVIHGCMIYHTMTPAESAEWIASFTQHISTIPHKYVNSTSREP